MNLVKNPQGPLASLGVLFMRALERALLAQERSLPVLSLLARWRSLAREQPRMREAHPCRVGGC